MASRIVGETKLPVVQSEVRIYPTWYKGANGVRVFPLFSKACTFTVARLSAPFPLKTECRRIQVSNDSKMAALRVTVGVDEGIEFASFRGAFASKNGDEADFRTQ